LEQIKTFRFGFKMCGTKRNIPFQFLKLCVALTETFRYLELCSTCFLLKGTVSRDFWLLVFFMNQFPPSPRVFHLDRFKFFRKFAEIFVSQGAPPVSMTPVANLPPVSATPVANISTIFASVFDTCGEFAAGVNDISTIFATGGISAISKPY
jgi:hypothetical protein